MHYYKRNLGDYSKKAGRLSMLQHGAYTLLIDSCYDREEFPTMEEAIDWTWASSKEEVEAVEFVLRKFFVLEDGRYVQNRIREEIENYQICAERNSRIAVTREAKRAEKSTKRADESTKRAQTVDAKCTEEHEAPPNQEPLTINQEPLTKYKYLPDDLAIAEEMFEKIRLIVPTAKPPSYPAWANSIRLMRERDDRNPNQIRAVFAFANADGFWSANILSPDTLREKFDTLTAKQAQARASPARQSRHTDFEKLDYTAGVDANGRF